MKKGLKSFLLGGKNCTGGVGVLAAVAGAVIGIGGTVIECVIKNKMAAKADEEIEAEEEAKELETTEEVEVEPEVVKEETEKKG